MGIFRNCDVITLANAVLDRRINAVIGGAAADDKLANALVTKQRLKPGVVEGITGRFGHVKRVSRLMEFRQ